MERTLYLIIICFFINKISFAQSSYSDLIYDAYISGNMDEWKIVIDKMQNTENKSVDFRLDLINQQIGYIGWCIGMNKKDVADDYIKKAQKHLAILREKEKGMSYVNAYQGSIDGMRIGLNMLLAPFIGNDIISKALESIKLDENNPYGYILYANSKYYMWSMMGGSKNTAIKYYRAAEILMERQGMNNKSWNYLSLLTIIAHAFEEMDDYSKANQYYEKIMEVEPDYSWVKNELYPEFLKKYKNGQ